MSKPDQWSYMIAESCHVADIDDTTGNELREYLRTQAGRFLPGDAIVLMGSDEVWLYHAEDRRRCPGFNEVAVAWLRLAFSSCPITIPKKVDMMIALHDGTVGTIRACVQWEPKLVGVEVAP